VCGRVRDAHQEIAVLKINYRPEIEEHMREAHFNIFPKPWMNNKRIWFWQKGNDPRARFQGPYNTQREAEDAALAWYDEQTTHRS
jgi:hypothetical protein